MTIAPEPLDRIEILPSDPRWPDAFADDRETCTEGKTAFIEAILARR